MRNSSNLEGELPSDWLATRIGDIATVSAGGTPDTSVSSYWGGDTPWMNSGELNLRFVEEVEGRITELGLKNSSTKFIPKDSVLIGLAGQGKTRGTVAINTFELCTNQSIAAIYPSVAHDTKFLYYALDARYEELRSLSDGGGGRGGLNLSLIKDLVIPMPSDVHEQRQIADKLYLLDDYLSALEQLVMKKKGIRAATAKELLERGAKSATKTEELGFFLRYEQPTKYLVATTDYKDFGPVRVLTAGKTFILGHTDETFGVYENLPVILFDDFTTDTRYVDFPFKVKSSAAKFLSKRQPLDNLFYVNEVIRALNFKPYDHKRFWISEFSKFEVSVPSPQIQSDVADTLQALDKEISLLEDKKAKVLNIKTSLMQLLLTGARRVA